MKVVLINGSPREHGCTYTALSEVAKTLVSCGVETEIFWIGNRPISGCTVCGYCKKGAKCAIDDRVNELIARIPEFSGMVVGSPVYYAGPAGQLNSFLDRLFYAGRGFEGKPAAAVVSCRRGGEATAFDRINKYFTISGMPVVSSQYWNMVHGSTPDEVKEDLEGMQTMRTLGRNMAWLLRCIEAGKEAGIAYPEHEPVVRTNFIR